MNLRVIFSGLIVVAAVGTAVGLLYWKRNGAQIEISPRVGEVVEAIYGLGTVVSDRVYNVRSGLTLQIRKIMVSEGDIVKPGDVLLQLDQNSFRSPISGTVTHIAFREGEIIPPQVPIISVTNLEALYLEVSLEQQSVLRVKSGQKVAVSFESLRNEKVEGKVTRVYPRDSQFIVRIEIGKWPDGVLSGMTADVAIEVGRKADALLVPVRALVAGQITRVRAGKQERVPVRLGVVDGEWAEVLGENLKKDDQVMVRSK